MYCPNADTSTIRDALMTLWIEQCTEDVTAQGLDALWQNLTSMTSSEVAALMEKIAPNFVGMREKLFVFTLSPHLADKQTCLFG